MQRPRRIIITTLICLLLGALINIVIAWACKIIITPQTDGWESHVGIARLDDHHVWQVFASHKPGRFSIDSVVCDTTVYEISPDDRDDGYEDPASLLQSWNRVPNQNDLTAATGQAAWEESAAGWPLLSMWSRLTIEDPGHNFVLPNNPRVLTRDELEHGWLLNGSALSAQIILPTGVIWPAFVLNTLFYASIFGALAWTLSALRRHLRRARGRCPACGYNLRGNLTTGCPECAWNRTTTTPK